MYIHMYTHEDLFILDRNSSKSSGTYGASALHWYSCATGAIRDQTKIKKQARKRIRKEMKGEKKEKKPKEERRKGTNLGRKESTRRKERKGKERK